MQVEERERERRKERERLSVHVAVLDVASLAGKFGSCSALSANSVRMVFGSGYLSTSLGPDGWIRRIDILQAGRLAGSTHSLCSVSWIQRKWLSIHQKGRLRRDWQKG